MAHFLSSWGRSPLLHFLALGGLLLAADAIRDDAEGDLDDILVDEAQVRLLQEEYRSLHQQTPDLDITRRLVDSWIDREVKVREARRLGFDEDLLIRRRMVEKMEVLLPLGSRDEAQGTEPSASAHDVADLYEQAVALGLDRNDPIIRARLVKKLETHWAAAEGPIRASREELTRFAKGHRERFARPGTVRVSHVFVAGPDADSRARQLLRELRRSETAPQAAVALGDAFLAGHHLPLRSERRLTVALGAEAARLAFSAPTAEWVGPVASPWGVHLLWVHDRRDGALPSVDVIRPQILLAMAEERREQRIEQATAELRQRFDVEIVDASLRLRQPAERSEEQQIASLEAGR